MNDSLQIACPRCAAINRVPATKLGQSPSCGRCHRPLFDGQPVALDEASFAAHLQRGDLPVLVDFWAPWCGPCLAMAPQFDKAASLLEPKVRLAKIDTEAHPALAQPFGIRSIPTMVLFERGRERARISGAMSAADIVRWVQQQLG